MAVYILSELINGWYCAPYPLAYNSLTQDEKRHNANLAMSFLRQNGFTIYAASGMVGNMWAESQMNPSTWEVINNVPAVYSGGYGLVQWTPYTNYSQWVETDHPDEEWENNGPLEMQRILYERQHGLEFYPSSAYPQWRWSNFSELEPSEGETINEAINKATDIFLRNYLRPSNPDATLANRQYLARWVYQNAPGTVLNKWLLLYWSNRNRKRSWIT